jgi:hypothetical protein
MLDEGLQFLGFGGEGGEEEFVVDLEGYAEAQAARRSTSATIAPTKLLHNIDCHSDPGRN